MKTFLITSQKNQRNGVLYRLVQYRIGDRIVACWSGVPYRLKFLATSWNRWTANWVIRPQWNRCRSWRRAGGAGRLAPNSSHWKSFSRLLRCTRCSGNVDAVDADARIVRAGFLYSFWNITGASNRLWERLTSSDLSFVLSLSLFRCLLFNISISMVTSNFSWLTPVVKSRHRYWPHVHLSLISGQCDRIRSLQRRQEWRRLREAWHHFSHFLNDFFLR